MSALIIRTSDRNQFRRCRVAWDFGSKIRQNYQTVKPIEPLDFGSAIHEAMQVLYDPRRWDEADRTLVLVEAHAAFMQWMVDWEKRLKALKQWDMQSARHAELIELGKGMIDNYVWWVTDTEQDKYIRPIHVEIEFEIPIPVAKESIPLVNSRPGFTAARILLDPDTPSARWSPGYYLHKYVNDELVLVLYQGRIDLIHEDLRTGKYWIDDHKTAAQFGDTTWQDLDTQTRSYAWATKKVLGINVEGVMFNRLRKKLPPKLDRLKDGSFSRNKSRDISPELYRKQVVEDGQSLTAYKDFLSYFTGQPYFQRLPSVLTDAALVHTERAILMEAMDMLGNPFIYANPDMFNCRNCSFFAPCQAMHDGQDPQWVLDHSGGYINRAKLEAPEVKNF